MSLTNQHIDQLLTQCKKGNQLAQMEVYNRYYQAMFTTANRILNNTEEAEDAMQEAFLTAFQKLDTFKGNASFGAWLKRIVVNNSISRKRKYLNLEELPENGLHLEDETETAIDKETLLQAESSRVLNTIATLKESYRQALTLHYFEGYDYEEMTEILQINYANCRTLVSRAKDSLRKKLSS